MNDELGQAIIKQLRELQKSINICVGLLCMLAFFSSVAFWRFLV